MGNINMRYTGILEIILTIASSTPRNMAMFECVDQPENQHARWQNVVRRNRVEPRLELGRDNNNNIEHGPPHILQLSTCPARLDVFTTTTIHHHIIFWTLDRRGPALY
jgi:hypothetical protein